MDNNKNIYTYDYYIESRKDTYNVLNDFHEEIKNFIFQALKSLNTQQEKELLITLNTDKLGKKIALWLKEFVIPDNNEVNEKKNDFKELKKYLNNKKIQLQNQNDKKLLISLIRDTFGIVFITYNHSKNSSYYHILISDILSKGKKGQIMNNLFLPAGKGTVGWIESLDNRNIGINLDNTFLDPMGSVASEDLICGARSAYLIPIFNSKDEPEYIGNLFFFSPIEGFFTTLDSILCDKNPEEKSKDTLFTSFLKEQFELKKLALTIAYDFECYKKAFKSSLPSSTILKLKNSIDKDNPCKAILNHITKLNSEVDSISLFDYATSYDEKNQLCHLTGGVDDIVYKVIDDIGINQKYGIENTNGIYEQVKGVFCDYLTPGFSDKSIEERVSHARIIEGVTTTITVEINVEFIFIEGTTDQEISDIFSDYGEVIKKVKDIFWELEFALTVAKKSTEELKEDSKIILDAESFLFELVLECLKPDNESEIENPIFLDVLAYVSDSSNYFSNLIEKIREKYIDFTNYIDSKEIRDLKCNCDKNLLVANLKLKSNYSKVFLKNEVIRRVNNIELKKAIFNLIRLNKDIENKYHLDNDKLIIDDFKKDFPILIYNKKLYAPNDADFMLRKGNFEFLNQTRVSCILSLVHFNKREVISKFVKKYNCNDAYEGVYHALMRDLKNNTSLEKEIEDDWGREYKFGSGFVVKARYTKDVSDSNELKIVANKYFSEICELYEKDIYRQKYASESHRKLVASNDEKDKLRRINNSSSPILIFGKPGSGKDFLAQYCHNEWAIGQKPHPFGRKNGNSLYCHINCSEFNELEFQDEVFGSVKGFHKRGDDHKIGLIFQLFGFGEYSTTKTAENFYHYLEFCIQNKVIESNTSLNPEIVLVEEKGLYRLIWKQESKGIRDKLDSRSPIGTLYLSNIESLDKFSQGKLLNYIETGKFRPLGWYGAPFQFNVRVIASSSVMTERKLKEKIKNDLIIRLRKHVYKIKGIRERIHSLKESESPSEIGDIFQSILSFTNDKQRVTLDKDAIIYLEELLLSKYEDDMPAASDQCPIHKSTTSCQGQNSKLCSNCSHTYEDYSCAFSKSSGEIYKFDHKIFENFLNCVDEEDFALVQNILTNAVDFAENGKVKKADINSAITEYLENE